MPRAMYHDVALARSTAAAEPRPRSAVTTGCGLAGLAGLLIWVAVAFLWYFFYSRHHSHLGRHEHVGLSTEDSKP